MRTALLITLFVLAGCDSIQVRRCVNATNDVNIVERRIQECRNLDGCVIDYDIAVYFARLQREKDYYCRDAP